LLTFALAALFRIALDLALWFAGVNLLWPLSEIMGWREVNLWGWLTLPPAAGNPDFIRNELAALDTAAFALYLGYLSRIARPSESGTRLFRFAGSVGVFAAVLFPVYVVTGFFLSEWEQSLAVYAPSIVLFFPTALISTIAFRRHLAGAHHAEVSPQAPARPIPRPRSTSQPRL
jgi:hypothetical protein